jgi:CheY-like chemotaxis protein/HPt (histidine-containing phosphotransfer) domain-containing protein
MKIVLADDDAANRKLFKVMLRRLGFEARTAENGEDLIEAIEREPADIAFVDLHMPVMDGLEAVLEIRRRWPAAGRPVVIALTATASPEDRTACLDAGMDDFILKPMRLQTLQYVIERWSQRLQSGRREDAAQDGSEGLSRFSARLSAMGIENSPEFIDEILGEFFSSTDRQLLGLHAALTSGNADGVFHLAHAIKGQAANFGFQPLEESCRTIESYARRGDLAFNFDVASDLTAKLNDALQTVDRYRRARIAQADKSPQGPMRS